MEFQLKREYQFPLLSFLKSFESSAHVFTCRIKFLKRMSQKTFYETFCGIIDEILLSFKLHVFQKNFQDLKSFSFLKSFICRVDMT